MIRALSIILFTLTIDLYTDLRLFRHNRKVRHARGALLRLIGFGPACWIYWPTVFLIPAYGVVFEMAYNKFYGQPLFYVGTTAWIDKLQRKNGWLIVLKYVLAVAGLVTFIKW